VTILESILEDKRREVAALRRSTGVEQIERMAREASNPPRRFMESLMHVPFALIAEIKKASPSKGTLVKDFDPKMLAVEFHSGGARALSVLTDKKYFAGDASFVRDVKERVDLPVLRKDFIVDEYQIYESRAIDADAILLIVRALSVAELKRFHDLARSLGMAVLVETHSRSEIEAANSIGAEIIGINNRDLGTFEVNIKTSVDLIRYVDRQAIAVSESGISSYTHVLELQDAGFRAALVGEGIVARADRVAAVRELIPR
jgi:indole-3-glycerol phosphate synthase